MNQADSVGFVDFFATTTTEREKTMRKNDQSIELLEHEAQPANQSSLALVQNTLTEFDKVEAGLGELRTKFKDVAYAVGTTEGMTQAKAARVEIRTPRYAVDKIAKAAKDPLNALKREIDTRAQTIIGELVSLETPIHEQIKAEEDRAAAEREAKKQAKVAAEAKAQAVIDVIRNTLTQAVSMNSVRIDEARAALALQELTADELGERTGEALQVKMQTLDALDTLHDATLAREAANAQAAADRAELDKIRAEQAERERAEREAREAAAAEQQARAAEEARKAAADLAAQRAAFEQEQAAARAALKAQADALTAQQAEMERAARAEQRRLDDIAAAERKVEEDKAAVAQAEQQRIAREAAAAEQARLNKEAADARAEADRKAAEQRAADEAADEAALQADQRGRDAWRVLLAALQIARAQVLAICEHNESLNGHASEEDRQDLATIDSAIELATGEKA